MQRLTEQQWQSLVLEYAEFGGNELDFVVQRGLHLRHFRHWLCRLPPEQTPQPVFVELHDPIHEPEPEPEQAPCLVVEIELPNGLTMRAPAELSQPALERWLSVLGGVR